MKKATLLAAAPIAAAFAIIAAPTAAFAAAAVTVTPSSVPSAGGSVTVAGTGFKANASLVVVECSAKSDQSACDLTNLGSATADASGAFSTSFTVKTGAIGNGTCSDGDTCYIAAAEAADQTDAGVGEFTVGAASTTSTGTPTTTSAPAPTAVAAGSGGGADRNGTPVGVIVLASLGGVGSPGTELEFAL